MSGPFETEREALDLPAVRAIYEAMHASSRRGVGDEAALRLLEDACAAAGVELGAYDRRILAWLAGWEAQMCAVIAGLITRAAQRRDALEHEAGLRAMNQAIEAAVRAYFRELGIVPPGDAQ